MTRDNTKIKYLEYLLIILITSYVFLSNIDQIEFHIDESTWITTSLYFDALIQGDTNSEIWDPGYWTLTQPPVTRYIIGVSRKLHDSGLGEINKPWDYRANRETNIKNGAMPSPKLLKIARLPMVIMAILSIFLLFFLVRKYISILASYTLYLLFISNNYLEIQLSRSMSESPLLLMIIMTAILLFISARLLITQDKTIFKNKRKLAGLIFILLFVGIFIGIAGGIKLNGFALLGVTIALFSIILFVSKHLNYISIKLRVMMMSMILGIVTFTCLFTFVSINPFLYQNTIERTVALFKWRLYEMDNQTKLYPSSDLTKLSVGKRVLKVGNNIFNKYASISFRLASILNLFLFIVGVIIVVRKSIEFLKINKPSLFYLLLLISFIMVAGPSLLTPLDWDRYFYLPVIFSTILISAGVAVILLYIYRKVIYKKFSNINLANI